MSATTIDKSTTTAMRVPTRHSKGRGLSACSKAVSFSFRYLSSGTRSHRTDRLPPSACPSHLGAVLEVNFRTTWQIVKSNNFNGSQKFLKDDLFQSLGYTMTCKKVDIVLPIACSGEFMPAEAQTPELETLCGPKNSKLKARLEFQPPRQTKQVWSTIPYFR